MEEIKISKKDLSNIIIYLELLEKVFLKGGSKCRVMLKDVRNLIKILKEKEKK